MEDRERITKAVMACVVGSAEHRNQRVSFWLEVDGGYGSYDLDDVSTLEPV